MPSEPGRTGRARIESLPEGHDLRGCGKTRQCRPFVERAALQGRVSRQKLCGLQPPWSLRPGKLSFSAASSVVPQTSQRVSGFQPLGCACELYRNLSEEIRKPDSKGLPRALKRKRFRWLGGTTEVVPFPSRANRGQKATIHALRELEKKDCDPVHARGIGACTGIAGAGGERAD